MGTIVSLLRQGKPRVQGLRKESNNRQGDARHIYLDKGEVFLLDAKLSPGRVYTRNSTRRTLVFLYDTGVCLSMGSRTSSLVHSQFRPCRYWKGVVDGRGKVQLYDTWLVFTVLVR